MGSESCVSVDVLLVEANGMGDNDIPSIVALSSSTLADIGVLPLLIGLISTWIFLSDSPSESESDEESKLVSSAGVLISWGRTEKPSSSTLVVNGPVVLSDPPCVMEVDINSLVLGPGSSFTSLSDFSSLLLDESASFFFLLFFSFFLSLLLLRNPPARTPPLELPPPTPASSAEDLD